MDGFRSSSSSTAFQLAAFFSLPLCHVVRGHVLRVSPPPLSTMTCPPASFFSSPRELASPCLVSARSQSAVATFPNALALIGEAWLSAWLHSLAAGLALKHGHSMMVEALDSHVFGVHKLLAMFIYSQPNALIFSFLFSG